jgi:hypothetical protein
MNLVIFAPHSEVVKEIMSDHKEIQRMLAEDTTLAFLKMRKLDPLGVAGEASNS